MGLRDLFRKRESTTRPGQRRFLLSIAGHGVEATPILPSGVAHLEDGTLLFGPINAAAVRGDLKNVVLKPGRPPTKPIAKRPLEGTPLVSYSSGEEGATSLLLGRGMDSLEGVLVSFRESAATGPWILRTDDHEIEWPARFTLRVDGNLDRRSWPYELALGGSSESLVFLQGPLTGPRELPHPEKLVAPGMELVDQGSLVGTVNTVLWFELAYEHGGVAWRQRFYYVPVDSESVYLLRTQGIEADHASLVAAGDLIASTFRPVRP